MPLQYDKITGALEDYAREHALPLVRRALALATPRPPLVFSRPARRDADLSDWTAHHNNVLRDQMRTVAARNNRFRMLILSRKVPFSFFEGLTPTVDPIVNDRQIVLYSCFSESALVSTNYILKYAQRDPPPDSINDRNTFVPSDSEKADAIFLAICAFLHQYNTYYLNTQTRRSLSSEITYETLTSLYNQRITDYRRASDVAASLDGHVMLGLTSPRLLGDATRVRFDLSWTGRFIELLVPNYVPLPLNGAFLRTTYSYMDSSAFATATGMEFGKFYDTWLVFQQLVLISLPLTWLPGTTQTIERPADMKFVERFFDVCETGLGGAPEEHMLARLQEMLEAGVIKASISDSDARTFLHLAKCEEFTGAVEFPEQRYLFYDLGNNLVLWDYLRHLGFWKALARHLVTRSGEIGRQKGAVFESVLYASVSTIPGTAQIKQNVRVSRSTLMGADLEIDLGFVWNKVLVVVESKSWFKRIGFYAATVHEVSERVASMLGVLERLDRRLRELGPSLGRYWDCDGLLGILPVVLSDEVEFIPSLEPTWWLVPGKTPRICLPDELLAFLRKQDGVSLRQHAALILFK